MLEMKVLNVAFFEQGGGFAVLLSDKDSKMILPIFVGPLEAQSIVFALENQSFPRPLTHDLMLNILNNYAIKLQKIVVSDIKDSTYFAQLFFTNNQNVISVIDSRPSDAIALALRANCPIYMAPKLIEFTYKYEDIIN